jgi:hypothetical protein
LDRDCHNSKDLSASSIKSDNRVALQNQNLARTPFPPVTPFTANLNLNTLSPLEEDDLQNEYSHPILMSQHFTSAHFRPPISPMNIHSQRLDFKPILKKRTHQEAAEDYLTQPAQELSLSQISNKRVSWHQDVIDHLRLKKLLSLQKKF